MATKSPLNIKLENDVPLPDSRNGNARANHLKTMKVGQSFVTQDAGGLWYTAATIAGMKISARKTTEGNTRIWRVK